MKSSQQPEISIVITVYNAASSISNLVAEVRREAAKIGVFEIILVDDGSKDASWKCIQELEKFSGLKAVKLSRNFGQHVAISCGIKQATGKYTVLMDGDFQDPPAAIADLYKSIKETEKNIVYAQRVKRKEGFFKRLTGLFFHRAFQIVSGIQSDHSVGTFRIFDNVVRETFLQFNERGKFIGGIFYWMGFNTGYIPIQAEARVSGKSGYNLFRLLKLAKLGMVGFSNKPLTLAIYLGFISSLVSVLMAIYFIYVKIFNNIPISGYTSLIVSLFFIGGLILFVLGILGEYIGQIYEQVKQRPEFIIAEEINITHE